MLQPIHPVEAVNERFRFVSGIPALRRMTGRVIGAVPRKKASKAVWDVLLLQDGQTDPLKISWSYFQEHAVLIDQAPESLTSRVTNGQQETRIQDTQAKSDGRTGT